MPNSPPQSLLITPDLRRRLQQRYEEALRLAAQPRPDFRRVHELLAECVRADPGNILYLDALLANLRRRDSAGGQSWWGKLWASRNATGREKGLSPNATSPEKSESVLSTEYSVLQDAPSLLWQKPKDTGRLKRIAAAASAFDFDGVELCYLHAASELDPDDIDSLRMLAQAMTRQGRFEDAVNSWRAVLALKPGDNEAEQAIADLSGPQHGVDDAPIRELQSSDAPALIERAKALQEAGDLAAAEDCLTQAQAASGGDLAVLALREELRMRQMEQRVAISLRRAVNDPHPKAQRLVRRFEDEQNRLEIEIFNARAERWPGDAPVRVELARRLKRAGNFSGAVQRLDEALRLRPDDPAALIELGECWQHLRQFSKALGFYKRAAQLLGLPSDESGKLAHYRAGVLAAALGLVNEARAHFKAVIAANSAFKDAAERLDKLGHN